MAMMDNVDFLISHIRNSFVTSDDTSMSEWIITECRFQEEPDLKRDGNFKYNKNANNRTDTNGDYPSDGELKGSVDIHPDMDFGAHRRRSNTAQRLDKMKKDKRNQGKMKTITWKDVPDSYQVDDKSHLFEWKELPELNSGDVTMTDETDSSHSNTSVNDTDKKSSLTQQLENLEAHGSNPFFKYAKFDGRIAGGTATRKLDIFIAFAPPDQRSYPMTVIVTSNARAADVVGLVCWQYTEEGRKPDLESVIGHFDPNEDLSKFSLHMAEDDGEIDMDFPPIVTTDPVSKYGFTKFAMVANAPVQPKSVFVTISVPNQGFNTLQVESMNVSMRELMEKVIKKRKIRIPQGLNYTLEKTGRADAGKPIDLEATLGSMNCFEFYLIRENSSRGNVEAIDDEDQRITESLMSHHYKSFIVSMVHKLRTNTDVQLGISGDKIEIDPVSVKGTARLFRQKPVTYDADSIADCDISETKSNGRCVFQMTYLTGPEYKRHYFEADQSTANEIVEKINNILELKLSPVRKEFVYSQEKKALKKRDSIKYQQ